MRISVTRRELLKCGAAVSLLPCRSQAQPVELEPTTHTYKTIGDLTIKADVYRPRGEVVLPVVVWIHGGALIMGHRSQITGRVKRHMLDAGYVLISLDYRLAPETQLPEIVHDLEDAFAWIRSDGPRLFQIDPTRIAVIGGSAGGYLTLASGYRVQPRPTVLLSLFGYGDLIGDWYSTPSPHPCHNQQKVSRDEAYRQVSGPPISDSRDRNGDGGVFYQYCRQTGTWPTAVSGWDPIKDASRFHPFMPVKNVTPDYPPTVMIHGTIDTDVPYEQSVLMAEQFQQHKVRHELITIPGAEHGFAGGDPMLIEEAYTKAFAFIDEHLQ